ncbi:hypothetical protein LVJ94_37605 [Pendulispora rubella]|uniref:ATP-grasp domain-containing protein n=1 Tax=Pendulispora rubella TaxID=2741070 RepID=A0ABZ2KX19_9BACT
MAARIAWVLNLDADLELATPRPGGYSPKKSVLAAMQPMVARLAAVLLGPNDVLVEGRNARGLPGRAFCPTPRACKIFTAAGAVPEPHPPVEVLRRVNSRAFASAMGATLPSGRFVTSLDEARAMLAASPAVGRGWRIKRAFGMTGRGQRPVDAGAASEADLAFVRAGLAEGGVQIEPNVSIVDEYAIHGMLDQEGTHALGVLVKQRCDAHGSWVATDCIPEPTRAERTISARLAEEAARVAEALGREGYFGPFGIDAYTYRDRAGTIALQPRSEINARYTMGFAIGFGVISGREAPR